MATLYSHTSTETSGNCNWNVATDNYASPFVATGSGIPDQLVLRISSVTGTPTCNIFIRNQNTVSGATTYASASGVTLTSGTNTISLTGVASITATNTYYVWIARTSDTSNFPAPYFKTTGAAYTQYRAAAADSDPTTSWFTGDISMDVNGTLSVPILILRG